MSTLPLVEGVLKYVRENKVSFCMPGHKGGKGFLSTPEGRMLYDNFLKGDITEVDGVDNLHHAEGIIKESQELLSKFYGSSKSYFLVNGSTSGNLAMIFSTLNENEKVLVERNCHRSIFNGIIMRKLKPVYIENTIDEYYNAPLCINMEHYLRLIEEHSDAKAVIVTYPNYYGVCSNLEAIIKEAKKHNMKVLVDSAHGAHFGVNDRLPKSAVRLGADMVVMSSHKTLPSLTQTSYLHINDDADRDKVDFYVSALLSTSPSYMLMCSMDYARYYLECCGKRDYDELIDRAIYYRDKINSLGYVHVLSNTEGGFYDTDVTRYTIHVSGKLSGNTLHRYLRSKGIQSEMSNDSNVVLIFSPFNDEEDFKKLYEALRKCPIDKLKDNNLKIDACIVKNRMTIPKAKYLPHEVVNLQKIKVDISNAKGKVCAHNIVPYPPGIPLVMMGELIGEADVNMVKYYLENKKTVLGVDNGFVTVVKD